jgi:hypothetical protein
MSTPLPEPVERVRNQLLRRADWRFLLADPAVARSAYAGGGELLDALRLISPSATDHIGGECDLLVAVDPDDQGLRRAFQALRPGGQLYVEWSARRVPSRTGSGVRLARAGFEGATHYAPHPHPGHGGAERWLPLDAPAAIDFAFGSRPAARTALRRLARRVQHALLRSGGRTGSRSPLCAIATKPLPPPPRGGTAPAPAAERTRIAPDADGLGSNPWDAAVRRGWSGWGFGPTPRRLASLLLTPGARSVNKVVALVFADGEASPRVAVKMPRVPESVPTLAREAATLLALQSRPVAVPGIPRVLFQETLGGLQMLGQSAVLGRRFTELLDGATFPDLARRATSWQIALAGRHPARHDASQWRSHFEPVIADFEASFGTAVDPVMLREAADEIGSLTDLPIVCEQRDFAPWNILRTATGEVAVLDWESSVLQGVPTLDLSYLLTYLAIFLDGASESGRYEESYLGMLDPGSRIGAVAGECQTAYLGHLGLDAGILRPLRLFAWMLHSRSAVERLRSDTRAAPTRAQLRATLFLRLWEAELLGRRPR